MSYRHYLADEKCEACEGPQYCFTEAGDLIMYVCYSCRAWTYNQPVFTGANKLDWLGSTNASVYPAIVELEKELFTVVEFQFAP